MEKTFKILNDSTSAGELESALKSGSDLVIVSSPSEYFEGSAAQNAIGLMKKYPERKIFVTSRVSPLFWKRSSPRRNRERGFWTPTLTQRVFPASSASDALLIRACRKRRRRFARHFYYAHTSP